MTLPHCSIAIAWLLGFSALAAPAHAQAPSATSSPINVVEASITDLQSAMTAGRATSLQLVDAYLARVAAYDHAGPALNTLIRLNGRARRLKRVGHSAHSGRNRCGANSQFVQRVLQPSGLVSPEYAVS